MASMELTVSTLATVAHSLKCATSLPEPASRDVDRVMTETAARFVSIWCSLCGLLLY